MGQHADQRLDEPELLRAAGGALPRLLEITIKKPSVWVLNPGMLAARINRERTRLGAEDIALISLHISRYGHMALDDHARSQ